MISKSQVFIWAIAPDLTYAQSMCTRTVRSAKKQRMSPNFVGVGEKYYGFKQKLTTAIPVLSECSPDTIAICVDGSDVLFTRPIEYIVEKFESLNTEILIAADRGFAYQWPQYKDRYDQINSPYRYVNAGVLIGRAGSLVKMMEECLSYPEEKNTDVDQGLIGIWAYQNNHDSSRVRLDTNCDLIWVTSEEWDVLDSSIKFRQPIVNPTTNTVPAIIHVPCIGNSKFNGIYESAFQSVISS